MEDYEKAVVSQLKSHKRLIARIKILERYPVGFGVSVGSMYADIQKVIEARAGTAEGDEAVLERISELQELEVQKAYLDSILEELAGYEPKYAELLTKLYLQEKQSLEVAEEFNVSKTVFYEWRKKAISEYAFLMGASAAAK